MRFISHELRTPLNSVFMGMQLSIDQIPEDTQEPSEQERRETLVETQSACGAALDILNELLLFDKLESGALVLNKQDVPVPELVEDSIKIFTVQAREKGVELLITNSDEGMLGDRREEHTPAHAAVGDSSVAPMIYDTDEVTVDKNKVVQVIRNVVSNAIKFTPTFGKIQLNVRFQPDPSLLSSTRSRSASRMLPSLPLLLTRYQPVATHLAADDHAVVDDDEYDIEMTAGSGRSWMSRRLGFGTTQSEVDGPVIGELVIEVRDSGAGISEENQRRLFKEVVQFNPELLQNGGGSGLGMCISKGIMDMHGGSISVHSAGEGQGSLFTLRLPMRRVYQTDQSAVYIPTKPSPLRSPSALTLARAHSRVSFPNSSDSDLDSGSEVKQPDSPGMIMPEDVFTARVESLPSPLLPAPAHSLKLNSVSSLVSLTDASAAPTTAERMLRFLVVDDSSLNRKMLCRLLRNKGHDCTEAEDGVQAVAIMKAALAAQGDPRFDMVLMDFM